MKIIKAIKQFYLTNKGISIIGIISLMISMSYVLTYKMPDYFGIEPLYAWLNNIAISYIAAMIFFVVQVYIPEQKNKKQCMEVLRNNFVDLAKFIDLTILVCQKHIEIKDKGAKLFWNGDGNEEKIYINYSSCNDINKFSNKSYTKAEIFGLANQYNKKIEKIKQSSVIKFCDYELLEVLTKLETINFYANIQYIIEYANTEINFQSFKEAIVDLQKLNDKLKNLCRIDIKYQLHEVEGIDKIFADLPRSNVIKHITSAQEFNVEIQKQDIKQQLKAQGVVTTDEDINAIAQCRVESATKKNKSEENKQ